MKLVYTTNPGHIVINFSSGIFTEEQKELLCNIFEQDDNRCCGIAIDGNITSANLIENNEEQFSNIPKSAKFIYRDKEYIKLATQITNYNCVEIVSGKLGNISKDTWVTVNPS